MRLNLTFSLIAANVLLFIAQLAIPGITETFSLTPSLALSGAYWQFLTYMFMHGGFLHIFFNMFVLLIFGLPVESSMGSRWFGALYFLSGIGSALFYMILTYLVMPLDIGVMMLGASGAIFAVLAAYGFLFPRNLVWGLFLPIPIPAKYAVVFFAGLELFLGFTGIEPGIANFGHLGGIITGVLFMLAWRGMKRRRRPSEYQGLEFIWE